MQQHGTVYHQFTVKQCPWTVAPMVEASGMEHVQQDNTALGFSGDSWPPDDLHDTSMTPERVVCRLLFMARPTPPSWGVPISKHGCLPSASSNKTAIHPEM